jgi:hypothetical protein
MGFRYRSSIRILPGLRVNLSKSGASLSVGGRGATVNVGSRGTRATVGLPGTGLSWSERIRPGRGGRGAPIVGWLIAIVAVVAIVVALGR